MTGENIKTAATGLLGTSTSIGAAIYSMLPHLEAWVRFASVTVGLIVGLVTLFKLLKRR
jgi:hypothetical protein